ncbi:hypothetical protein ABZ461_39455 [Actinacidiphila glaucinigra]|uniref:hypothetical protein n=1 Tax=Actinacidiphila glaucinigra TaxID=235986 RepID=UPI0033CCDA40
MTAVTDSAALPPALIPGYDGGPFRHVPGLLDDQLFWEGHLHNCAQEEEAEELLLGADGTEAMRLHNLLLGGEKWPVFSVPLAGGRWLHVVYRAFTEDEGVDYLLHDPGWESAELLAVDEGHFTGPGLSWAELVAVADNGLPGGSTDDPHARLLLLLPAFGDDAVPADAEDRVAAALRARTRVGESERLAAALLEEQGPCGPVHWTAAPCGYRTNVGEYSFRNPAGAYARDAARLERIARALAP